MKTAPAILSSNVPNGAPFPSKYTEKQPRTGSMLQTLSPSSFFVSCRVFPRFQLLLSPYSRGNLPWLASMGATSSTRTLVINPSHPSLILIWFHGDLFEDSYKEPSGFGPWDFEIDFGFEISTLPLPPSPFFLKP